MNRFVLGSVFVACLLVLCTYHAAYHDLHEEYPGNEEVISGIEGAVSVYGTVVAVGDETFTLRLTQGSGRGILKYRPEAILGGTKAFTSNFF